jgi:hypothetical protein
MPEKAATYRVRMPLVASTHRHDGPARFVALPRGSLIVAPGEFGPLGLVEVECEGRKLSVFSRDIRERAVKIEEPKSSLDRESG